MLSTSPGNTLSKGEKNGAATCNFRDKFNPGIPGIILFGELLMVHTHRLAHKRINKHNKSHSICNPNCARAITVNVRNASTESFQFA